MRSPPDFSVFARFAPTKIRYEITSGHPAVDLDELAILVESNARGLIAACNQSANHDRVCSNSQSLAHVTRVLVSTVRAQGNTVLPTNRHSVDQGRQLRDSTAGNYSGDADAAIADTTPDAVCATSNQVLGTLARGDGASHDV